MIQLKSLKNKLRNKYFSGLTRNTFLLALGSLFGDISSEMLYPLLPIYLSQTLLVSGAVIGIIEGVAQAAQNIIQGFSGYWSDRLEKRKTVALIGYLLSAISKPWIGIASHWPGVFAARLFDRLGAGTRSAPRDALVALSVEPEHRGKAFGLEGIGDNLGAFIGPMLTVLLFFSFQFDIHFIFYLSIIPGLIAVAMVMMVKESKNIQNLESTHPTFSLKFPKAYWKYLGITALFGLGNSSNAFLILQMKELGFSLVNTVLAYAFFNLVAALISYPAGSLSDRIGRKTTLMISFFVFILAYWGFALFSNIYFISLVFIVYGLFQGFFRTSGKSLASQLVPKSLQASGAGWYSTTVGLSGLIASIAAGQLWEKVSHLSVFVYGAVFASMGIIALFLWTPTSVSDSSLHS